MLDREQRLTELRNDLLGSPWRRLLWRFSDADKREFFDSVTSQMIDEVSRAGTAARESGFGPSRLKDAVFEAAMPMAALLRWIEQTGVRKRLNRASISIPEEYLIEFVSDDPSSQVGPAERFPWERTAHNMLTDEGALWARRELRKHRQQRIEFWAKLVLPVLALVVSIIALVLSVRAHH